MAVSDWGKDFCMNFHILDKIVLFLKEPEGTNLFFESCSLSNVGEKTFTLADATHDHNRKL